MTLPEIQEIKSYRPQPGDVLIVRNTEIEIDQQQADDVKRLVRQTLGLPNDFPVMAVGRDWEVTVGKLPE